MQQKTENDAGGIWIWSDYYRKQRDNCRDVKG